MAMPVNARPDRFPVAGVLTTATTYVEATQSVIDAARARRNLLLAATSVHGITLAARDAGFKSTLNSFDIVTPDGQPVRWALNLLHGARLAERVYGPTLTRYICAAAAAEGLSVYFYGSTPAVLRALATRLSQQFPDLRIAGYHSPPFRVLTDQEEDADGQAIIDSGASIVFVGLGCPRQERWAFNLRARLNMPVLCVGAAFDFHAGTLRQAPLWMQRRGLEWAFRLAMEPRRLWRRYAQAVPLFVLLMCQQYFAARFSRSSA